MNAESYEHLYHLFIKTHTFATDPTIPDNTATEGLKLNNPFLFILRFLYYCSTLQCKVFENLYNFAVQILQKTYMVQFSYIQLSLKIEHSQAKRYKVIILKI